jgi:pseudouridine-5'-phosphate glycosidase
MIRVSDEVRDALAAGRAVVALESTIFSRLGLPSPANAEALDRCLAAVRAAGAVPALTAVLSGVACVGIDAADHDRILDGEPRKAAARDLPIAIAQAWPFGATTVSASLQLAAASSIRVFATGGIGGVHRGAETTGDVSADLHALASHPVVAVSAGAKAFLDLPRTLEWLEAHSVPVVGWQTDQFPAFYSRTSGLPVPQRMDSAQELAALVTAAEAVGSTGGVLIAVPIPAADEIPWPEIAEAIHTALGEAAEAGMTGAAVTPFVLDQLAKATDGRTIPANLALAEHNASVAGAIAAAIAERS